MATFHSPHFRRLGILLTLSACSSFAYCREHSHYRAVEIGALGGVLSFANSVNDQLNVVGDAQYADGHTQAFLWSPTSGLRRIQSGVKESTALCINNKGQIAGAIRDSNDLLNAIVWTPNLTPIIVAEAPFGAVATCINEKGQAVGFRDDGVFDVVERAFLWPAIDPNSAWTDLFGSGSDSFATGINTRGEIVGAVDGQAFLRRPNGRVFYLAGDPNSGPAATAVGINDKGNVLVSQLGQAFLFTANATVPIHAPSSIFPNALNQSDEVVGFAQAASPRAFIWNPKDGYAEINGLLDTPGWRILSGNSINRDGDIAGYGVHNGRRRAVLLIPVKTQERQATP